MRLLYFGTGEFAIPTLDVLLAGPHEVVRVVTQPDRPRGRGRGVTPTAVKRVALDRGVDVLSVADVNATDVADDLLATGADLAVVVAFGQKIGPKLLDGLPGGMINLHASLLPRHRGAAPINWAVLAGDGVTGVTVFRLTDRMDAGPILCTRSTPVAPGETAAELHDRLAEIGPEAVAEALACFEGNLDPPGEPQDESQATTAGKLTKADGILDLSEAAEALARRVHGLWSWPGAMCRFRTADGRRDEQVTFARVEVDAADSGDAPGTVTGDLTVATGAGTLKIVELKPAGGKLMPWTAYVNGRHVQPGDRFVAIEKKS